MGAGGGENGAKAVKGARHPLRDAPEDADKHVADGFGAHFLRFAGEARDLFRREFLIGDVANDGFHL